MKVRGYVKPESAFLTLEEWEDAVKIFLYYQENGIDTRGAKLPGQLEGYVNQYFGYLLNTDAPRHGLLTTKNVLDFIEDFVNHRFWALEEDLGRFFDDVSTIRISYFYSRGDIEPYILLDNQLTHQLYGNTWNPKRLMHYTTQEGLDNIVNSLNTQSPFDISAFTIAKRPFFDRKSQIKVMLMGNVRAGFRSDVKSLVVDSGRRAVNVLRLEYPGRDLNNICYSLDDCDDEIRTSLWNEYIATPIKILEVN